MGMMLMREHLVISPTMGMMLMREHLVPLPLEYNEHLVEDKAPYNPPLVLAQLFSSNCSSE